jgi:hypothetical protein
MRIINRHNIEAMERATDRQANRIIESLVLDGVNRAQAEGESAKIIAARLKNYRDSNDIRTGSAYLNGLIMGYEA